MRIIKLKDKIGYAVIATVKVIPDRNGAAVSETAPSGDGWSSLRFKVKGASRQITKRDGTTMWRTQRMWCCTDSDSPFAPLIRTLEIGSHIFLVGTIASSKFADDEGRTRRTTYCTVEYIQPIVSSGGQTETECDPDDDDEIPFI